MKTILLKFSAPMQSWGTSLTYDDRWTDKYPSKSGVIGMIAAAFGYRRDEDEKLRPLVEKLSLAVRVDQSGSLLRDFQTAIKRKPNGDVDDQYLTNRYYLQDATFLVAIGSNDDQLMQDILGALRRPYFPLSLGRRSLPVNPDFIIGMDDKPIIESLRDTPWLARHDYQRNHSNHLDVWADSNLLKVRPYKTVRDIPISFTHDRTSSPFNHTASRQYRFRSVSYTNMTVDSAVK